MKFFLFTSCFLLAFVSFSQDSMKVIGIHPAIGKTISQDEKIQYKIFPEYSDTVFTGAYVLLNTDSSHTLVMNTCAGKIVKRSIDTKELDQIYYTIAEAEKIKQAEEISYVSPAEEETKEEKKKRRSEAASRGVFEVLGQVFIISLEVLLMGAFSF
jgi:hypothetical protein